MHVDSFVVDATVHESAIVDLRKRVELIGRLEAVSVVVDADEAVVLAHVVWGCVGDFRDLG